jgi:MFS family permease
VYGYRDLPHRIRAYLRINRHLGRGHPDGVADDSGIGVGGEWGGSVLLAMEWSRTHGQRGLVASWPQFGVPCGLFLSNLAILAFSQLSGDQFNTWGWRLPFALSIILVGVGLWIRLGILETPVFQQLLDDRKIEKAPIVEVFKKHPKEIILSALLVDGSARRSTSSPHSSSLTPSVPCTRRAI